MPKPHGAASSQFAQGDWVEVKVLIPVRHNHNTYWKHSGEWVRARVQHVHRDGRFELTDANGGKVIPALRTGIRQWHLRKATPPNAEPTEPAMQFEPAKPAHAKDVSDHVDRENMQLQAHADVDPAEADANAHAEADADSGDRDDDEEDDEEEDEADGDNGDDNGSGEHYDNKGDGESTETHHTAAEQEDHRFGSKHQVALAEQDEDELVQETIAENPARAVGQRPEWHQPSSSLQRMTVSQLRAVMKARGVTCEGCVEKAQLVDALRSHAVADGDGESEDVEQHDEAQLSDHTHDENYITAKVREKMRQVQDERKAKHEVQIKKEQMQKEQQKRKWAQVQREQDGKKKKEQALKERRNKAAERRTKQEEQEKEDQKALKHAQEAARAARAQMMRDAAKLQEMQGKVKMAEEKAAKLMDASTSRASERRSKQASLDHDFN